jgi:Icc protein
MEPLFFAHLTDTHLNAPENSSLFSLDMTAKFRQAIASLQQLEVAPAFVVISGDLAHEGIESDYRYIRKLIDEESAKMGIPFYVALGNHDHLQPFHAGYLNNSALDTPYYYSETMDGLRLIVLNTQVISRVDGYITPEQADWMSDVLATPAARGTVIVMHHPPIQSPTPVLDDHLLQNQAEFAQRIAGTDVIGILCGHVHFDLVTNFAGVPCATSSGVAFGLDLTARQTMRLYDHSAYNLVMIHHRQMNVYPMNIAANMKVLVEYNLPQK